MRRSITSFALSLMALASYGQVTNQGGLIYLKNTDVTISGDVDNSGTIVNDGTVSVSGNWTNTGKYKAAAGTLILNGDLVQHITHNRDSIYIWILKGSGAKILNDDAEVLKDLQFNGAVLTTQGGAVTVRNPGTITNPSATGYVNGLLYLEGSGKKFYPIGKNGTYVPVTLENVNGSPDVLLGFEAFEPNPGQPGNGIKILSNKRYWQLTKRGTGAFSGSLITLTLAADETIGSPSDVVVAESDAADQSYRSIGQLAFSATGDGTTVTSNLLITGSFFALATSGQLDETAIYVPNAFSPAAPSPEDQTIKVYGNQVAPEEFQFQVFSKWGNLIFESRSLQEMQSTGWRGIGNVTNTDATLGVYTYVMRGKFVRGNSFNKTGTITAIK
jgi:hypothetical protein